MRRLIVPLVSGQIVAPKYQVSINHIFAWRPFGLGAAMQEGAMKLYQQSESGVERAGQPGCSRRRDEADWRLERSD